MITLFNRIFKIIQLAAFACVLTSIVTVNAMKSQEDNTLDWYMDITKLILEKTGKVNTKLENNKDLKSILELQKQTFGAPEGKKLSILNQTNNKTELKSERSLKIKTLLNKLFLKEHISKDINNHPLQEIENEFDLKISYPTEETFLFFNNLGFDRNAFENICKTNGELVQYVLSKNLSAWEIDDNNSIVNKTDFLESNNMSIINALGYALGTLLCYVDDAYDQFTTKEYFTNILETICENNKKENKKTVFFSKTSCENLKVLFNNIKNYIKENNFLETRNKWIFKNSKDFTFDAFKIEPLKKMITPKKDATQKNKTTPKKILNKKTTHNPLRTKSKTVSVPSNKNEWDVLYGCGTALTFIGTKTLLALANYNSPNEIYRNASRETFVRIPAKILLPLAMYMVLGCSILHFMLPKKLFSPVILMGVFLLIGALEKMQGQRN